MEKSSFEVGHVSCLSAGNALSSRLRGCLSSLAAAFRVGVKKTGLSVQSNMLLYMNHYRRPLCFRGAIAIL